MVASFWPHYCDKKVPLIELWLYFSLTAFCVWGMKNTVITEILPHTYHPSLFWSNAWILLPKYNKDLKNYGKEIEVFSIFFLKTFFAMITNIWGKKKKKEQRRSVDESHYSKNFKTLKWLYNLKCFILYKLNKQNVWFSKYMTLYFKNHNFLYQKI